MRCSYAQVVAPATPPVIHVAVNTRFPPVGLKPRVVLASNPIAPRIVAPLIGLTVPVLESTMRKLLQVAASSGTTVLGKVPQLVSQSTSAPGGLGPAETLNFRPLNVKKRGGPGDRFDAEKVPKHPQPTQVFW
jgi:hypothetical protein